MLRGVKGTIMDITRYVTEIANRLIPANQPKNLASLFSVLLHELIAL